MDDQIGRQAAIDAVDAIGHIATLPDGDKCIRRSAVKYTLSMLPPAQPEAPCYLGSPCEYQNPNAEIREERTEKRTETHARDTIYRQVAIDAVNNAFDRETLLTGFVRSIAVRAIRNMPSAQPEEAIPVSWIESRIERFMTMDNAFGGLTANIMHVMLNEWRKEQKGETDGQN